MAGCAARGPGTYRLVEQGKSSVLIPPGVAKPDLSRRVFTADGAAGRDRCPAEKGAVEPRTRGRNVRLTVNRDALAKQPPGWLAQWTASAESRDCVAAGQGLGLGTRIVESVPLDPRAAYQLLHPPDRLTGYVDLGPEIRLQVNSPVLREGTPADAPIIESSRIDGLSIEVKSSDALLGFEAAWYAVRPRQSGVGFEIVPLSAEKHVAGGTEALAAPARNYFQFAPQAAFYRLFYKTDRGATRIVIAGAATRAALDSLSRELDGDTGACERSAMCVVMPQYVAANPDVVVLVNGREVPVPVGATIRAAIQANGEKDPARVLGQLQVRRLFRGKPAVVEFDRTSQEILGLILFGGEEIAWQ